MRGARLIICYGTREWPAENPAFAGVGSRYDFPSWVAASRHAERLAGRRLNWSAGLAHTGGGFQYRIEPA